MKTYRNLTIFFLSMVFLSGSFQAMRAGDVVTETVSFTSGGEIVSAYVARPGGRGPFPGLILIHEWWGLDEWVKQNAREFAGRGYVALAVDLYRGRVAKDRDLAHELSRALPQDRALRDMEAAIAYLRRQPYVIAEKIGSVGWCMGGGYSLQLAMNADLAAMVIAYGRLVTDDREIKKIGSPVLGIFGDQDRGIPVNDVRAFEKALNGLGISNAIHVYEDAGHAFMNPNNKRGYNEAAARDAWQKIYGFFDDTLNTLK
jgi:carboxymethylenebutenolidase